MGKREDKKRQLELRRQRLRLLTSLTGEEVAAVAGGCDCGRVGSRCCEF